jgi:hypothetical protein
VTVTWKDSQTTTTAEALQNRFRGPLEQLQTYTEIHCFSTSGTGADPHECEDRHGHGHDRGKQLAEQAR